MYLSNLQINGLWFICLLQQFVVKMFIVRYNHQWTMVHLVILTTFVSSEELKWDSLCRIILT